MSLPRTVLSFPLHGMRFNYRVAGIFVRNGHVLVCREDDDSYTMLPGGRVELGEASNVSLAREITEELKCTGSVGRMVFTSESFYEREDEIFQEMGFFYVADLPDDFPFVTDAPCLNTQDEGHELYFEWVPTSSAALGAVNLQPVWLHERLGNLPPGVEHVIFDAR